MRYFSKWIQWWILTRALPNLIRCFVSQNVLIKTKLLSEFKSVSLRPPTASELCYMSYSLPYIKRFKSSCLIWCCERMACRSTRTPRIVNVKQFRVCTLTIFMWKVSIRIWWIFSYKRFFWHDWIWWRLGIPRNFYQTLLVKYCYLYFILHKESNSPEIYTSLCKQQKVLTSKI